MAAPAFRRNALPARNGRCIVARRGGMAI